MAVSKKVYQALSLAAAITYIQTHTSTDLESMAWTDAQILMYAETLSLHARIDEIENQANEMMSPEKMMEMATGFLGGGLM